MYFFGTKARKLFATQHTDPGTGMEKFWNSLAIFSDNFTIENIVKMLIVKPNYNNILVANRMVTLYSSFRRRACVYVCAFIHKWRDIKTLVDENGTNNITNN